MPKLAIVLKGYPRLSETFIAQEILNLERAGFDITLYSLRLPTDNRTHPVHGEIGAGVVYLPEYLYRQPGRVLRGWWRCRRLAGYPDAWKQFLRDLMRDPSPNRVRRFGQAFVLAAELPRNMPALYAHFLHTPASVARYAAILRGLPWACSAHAKDIHTTPEWEITEKLAHCRWLTTCTSYNVDHLSRLAPPGKVMLNYHGLDLGRFGSAGGEETGRNGSDENDPVRLLSVGRAVEKKGYDGLLRALAALGPDLSILNSRIDRHGDRDGLPNVIVEAQSQGLAVIAANLSGIPELVESGVNGLLVPPEDESALTGALDNLIRNPEERTRMGAMGREKVQGGFTMEAAFQPLCRQLQELAAGLPPA